MVIGLLGGSLWRERIVTAKTGAVSILKLLLPVRLGARASGDLGVNPQHLLDASVPRELFGPPTSGLTQCGPKSRREPQDSVGQSICVRAASFPTRRVDDLVGATPIRGNDWGSAGERF